MQQNIQQIGMKQIYLVTSLSLFLFQDQILLEIHRKEFMNKFQTFDAQCLITWSGALSSHFIFAKSDYQTPVRSTLTDLSESTRYVHFFYCAF